MRWKLLFERGERVVEQVFLPVEGIQENVFFLRFEMRDLRQRYQQNAVAGFDRQRKYLPLRLHFFQKPQQVFGIGVETT
ncbi:hypothetical protein D3C87_2039520 [compost metagenome]